MRYLFTLALLFLLRLTAYSQCCPYLQPVQVLPTTPQPGDTIRLVFRVTTPSQGHQVSKELVQVGDTLRFTACYFGGANAAIQGYSDTVTVAPLPSGNYTIVFIGRMSSDPQQCAVVRSSRSTTALRIAGGALATRPTAPDWTLYPVPATGRQLQLQTPAREPLQAIRLLDITGRECYAHPALELAQNNSLHQLQLPGLPAGIYTLRVKLANGTVKNQRVVLQ